MLPCGAGPVLDESLVHAGAVDGFAHGPGVGGGDGGHAEEEVAVGGAARVRTGHALPRGAVPVLDERLVGGAVQVVTHRPDVVPGHSSDAVEDVVAGTAARVRAWH